MKTIRERAKAVSVILNNPPHTRAPVTQTVAVVEQALETLRSECEAIVEEQATLLRQQGVFVTDLVTVQHKIAALK